MNQSDKSKIRTSKGLILVIFIPVSYTHLDVYKRQSKVLSVEGSTIRYERGGKEYALENVDTVVSAVGVRSENSLVEELQAVGIEPIVIGDASKARNIHSATEEAFAAVNML